jgi:hypothetical protein
VSAFIWTLSVGFVGFWPAKSPDQPPKTEPDNGVATSVIMIPDVRDAEHAWFEPDEQNMTILEPIELVTRPDAGPVGDICKEVAELYGNAVSQ